VFGVVGDAVGVCVAEGVEEEGSAVEGDVVDGAAGVCVAEGVDEPVSVRPAQPEKAISTSNPTATAVLCNCLLEGIYPMIQRIKQKRHDMPPTIATWSVSSCTDQIIPLQ
jgi:hypothetical protein